MLMFGVSDPSQGDVELELHFDDAGLAFLTDLLKQAKASGHEHIFEGSHLDNGLTIERDNDAPIRLVTLYYEGLKA